MKSVILFVIILMLVGCSGGGGARDAGPIQVNEQRVALDAAERARLAMEAKRQRLEAEKKRTAHEEAERKRFEAFLIEQQRQMAEAEAQRQREAGQQRLEAERQRRLTAERDMGIWDNAVIAETVGDESLPLPWFRDRQVYQPWGARLGESDPATIPVERTFGPWADTSMNIHADMGAMSFGVRQDPHNGEFMPWMSGPDYSSFVGLRPGGMTWTGVLVGFTPGGEPVTGKATLNNINYDRGYETFNGYATVDLTLDNLEYRDTRATWGDGDLFYRAGLGWGSGEAVNLNRTFTFPYASQHYTDPVDPGNDVFPFVGIIDREDAPSRIFNCCRGDRRRSDDGVVHGMFFGTRGEGMAGTLQRDDLTAAFGGAR